MIRLFWSAQQARLRTAWRLVGQTVLLIVLSSCLGSAFLLPDIIFGDQRPYPDDASLLIANLALLPATLLSVWLAGRYLDRRRFVDFGMQLNLGWWLDFAAGLALGAFLMIAIFLVEWAMGWIAIKGTLRADSFGGNFPLALTFNLLLYLAVGIYEELLFRGYYLRNLAEGLHLPGVSGRGALLLSWVLTSGAFSLAHGLNPHTSVLSTVNLGVAGLFLGLGYVLSGNLALPIGLHITWNLLQGTVFGFPVSGGAALTSFLVIQQRGPELWTGGDFGPEAGLIGLLAMLTGSVAILGWMQWRRGRLVWEEQIAEYSPLGIS